MKVRHGGEADKDAVRRLRDVWQEETHDLPPWADASWESNEPEIDRAVAANGLFLADEDGEAVGFVTAWLEGHHGQIGDLYVLERGRRSGTGRALVEAVIENLRARGATHLFVGANLNTFEFYDRLGFREESRNLVLDLEAPAVGSGRSYGSIHVQSDDLAAVERAVRQFVPRLTGGSRGSLVTPPRNGWIAVYDDSCDREPSLLRRLAAEISDRAGCVVLALGVEYDEVVRFVLLEAGRVVDEYLSVPEHYGHLPPGDVIALAANPRVVARLTGADPAAVRAVARTAASPGDLPPPGDLLRTLADTMGIEGADHGWEDAPELEGSVRVEPA